MSVERATRELPADLYDALAKVAEQFGGVGAGAWFDGLRQVNDARAVPLCIHGCAKYAAREAGFTSDYQNMLWGAGIDASDNDEAVRRINQRRGRTVGYSNARVPFADYCAELGIVRASTQPAHRAPRGGG
jgi:hypothetical protein